MLSQQVKLVEAKSRTVEEMLADLPEWATKIVKAARDVHKHIEGSTYRREEEQTLLEAVENAKLEWWRR